MGKQVINQVVHHELLSIIFPKISNDTNAFEENLAEERLTGPGRKEWTTL